MGRLLQQVAGFQTPAQLGEKAGWPAEEVAAWFDGTFAFDLARAQELAQLLELDPPMFVGNALEVSLRSTEGGRP